MENLNNLELKMVWVGSKPPQHVIDSVASWSSQSQLNVCLITEVRRNLLWFDPKLISNRPWAQVADAIRLAELSTTPGWYMDVDCEPGTVELSTPPVTTLFRTEPNVLANGIFYLDANKDFSDIWKNEILRGLKTKGQVLAEATGPGALTRAVYVYNYRFGLERSRLDLHLASFEYFIHWPIQFLAIAKSLPRFLIQGKIATHFGLASWDETESELDFKISNLAKVLFWRIRNSRKNRLVNFLRFLASTHMTWAERLTRAAYRSTWILQASHVASANRLSDLVIKISSTSELVQGIEDLRYSYLDLDPQVNSRLLEAAGWTFRKVSTLGYFWERPSLDSILGTMPTSPRYK